jgi:nitroreductase
MITEAPVVLVGAGTSQRLMTNGHRLDSTDITIAMTFAMLEAHALGLGTCWMANYTEPELRVALGLSDDISVVAIMPLGYADESPEAKPRKPVDEVIEYI